MSYASVVAAANPVAWYRLNETSGIVAADSSGNGYDGEYLPNSGGAWTGGTQGVAGATADGDLAAEFNGTTGYVNIGALPTMTNWSIECLATPSSDRAEQTVFSNDIPGFNNDVLFGIQPESVATAKRWGVVHQDNGAATRTIANDSTNVVIGQDYHVVATSNGATLDLYVNGVLSAMVAKIGSALTMESHPRTWIGGNPQRGGAFRLFAGTIAEVNIYNYALSPEQVAAHYAAISDAGFVPRRRRNSLLLNSL